MDSPSKRCRRVHSFNGKALEGHSFLSEFSKLNCPKIISRDLSNESKLKSFEPAISLEEVKRGKVE